YRRRISAGWQSMRKRMKAVGLEYDTVPNRHRRGKSRFEYEEGEHGWQVEHGKRPGSVTPTYSKHSSKVRQRWDRRKLAERLEISSSLNNDLANVTQSAGTTGIQTHSPCEANNK